MNETIKHITLVIICTQHLPNFNHSFDKEIIIYIHQWVSTQWINVQSQCWEKVQWGIKSFLQTSFRLLHLQAGRLHRRQKMPRPKSSWRQNERRRSGSLWVIWSLWTGRLQVFFCCRLKNVNMQRRLRCVKCQAVQTNARRRRFTETFSHSFLCYLLSSTSTSAEWSHPRFLWENAPPALSLPLFPEEHPSHTGNDILKRREKNCCADYFKLLPIKKCDTIRWDLQLLNVC